MCPSDEGDAGIPEYSFIITKIKGFVNLSEEFGIIERRN